MDTIIFLCTGNTCRSPMAEGLFRAHNGEEKTGLTAASAGLYTENGLPASANAVAAAGERGADISAHRSRQLTAEMAENAKYLVCMTGSHYDRLCELFPDCADKIFTLLPEDISDPFGGDLATYRRSAAESSVVRAVSRMALVKPCFAASCSSAVMTALATPFRRNSGAM